MAIDERIRRELERAARPADPAGIYEELIRRRERRRLAHRVQAGVLAFVVFLVGIGSLVVLSRALRGDTSRLGGAGPEDGLIAFSVIDSNFREGQGLQSDVYAISPEGSDLTQLTSSNRTNETTVSLSPDARRVAFWRVEEASRSRSGLWVMDADGANARVVFETDLSIWSIEWSPDGSMIGFIGVEVRGRSGTELDFPTTLFTIDPDAGNLRRVVRGDHIAGFGWSPDGNRLLVERQYATENDRIGSDVIVLEADGTEVGPLTSDGASRSPTWSPDGSMVAFVRTLPVPGVKHSISELVTVALDGSSLGVVMQARALEDPAWSPDGSRIAIVRFPRGGDGNCELVVTAADGATEEVIADRASLGGCPSSISWGGEGRAGSVTQTGPSPTPSAQSLPAGAVDVGLRVALCDVTSVRGRFAPGVNGTAYVGTEATDACPKLGRGTQVLAIDVDDDGAAESSIDLDGCDPFCSAFAAPEVDGDGTDELLVQNVQFSIAGVRLYDVVGDPAEIVAVTVRSPGYPEGGLPAGSPPQFWIGGDGFNLDSLRCAGKERVLIQTSATMEPPDSPNAVWRAHEAMLLLHADAALEILGTRTFEEPFDGDPSFAQGGDVCGAPLPR